MNKIIPFGHTIYKIDVWRGLFLSGKMSEVYEAYDMEIEQSFRVRGALILKTDKGFVQLRQLETNEKRVFAEFQFKELLCDNGFREIDRCIKNIEGELITYDRYGNPYVMRTAYQGRECNITNIEDVNIAAEKLARFHIIGKKIFEVSEGDVHIRINGNFSRRNTELRRIRSYMGKRSPKRSFEELYINNFDYFYTQASECEKRYGARKDKNDKDHLGYCHGMYNHHSVIISEGDDLEIENNVSIINFDKFYVGNQLADLYHLIRKVIEKNDYDFVYFKSILEKYESIIKLSKDDIEYIYICLCYPEKFYKISNQYYNSSKNWISPKLVDKLNSTIIMEERKQKFLGKLCKYLEEY